MTAEDVGLWAGFVLTLMIFSYLLGDNVLYRLAVSVFVGLAAGFVAVVTVEGVLLPWIRGTITAGDAPAGNIILGLIPFALGLLLLLKTWRATGQVGNIAIAYVIGVGAAVALVGAAAGTLIPLTDATGSGVVDEELNSFLILFGVITSLIYFHYLARRLPDGRTRRNIVIRALGTVGQGFIVVALSAFYASALLTSLTIFTERIGFIVDRLAGN